MFRVVTSGRRAAAQLQRDATCTIVRPSSSEPTLNDTTGAISPASGTTVYDGPCRVRQDLGVVAASAEERIVSLRTFIVSIPLLTDWAVATDVEVDDVVTVTASTDPSMVGRSMVIAAVVRGDSATARRLICNEQAS